MTTFERLPVTSRVYEHRTSVEGGNASEQVCVNSMHTMASSVISKERQDLAPRSKNVYDNLNQMV